MTGKLSKPKFFSLLTAGAILGVALFFALFHQGDSSNQIDVESRVRRDLSRQMVRHYDEPKQLSVEGKLKLAMEMVDNGEVEEASDVLQQILYDEPENVNALLELSLIELLDRGRPQAALPYLIKALQADPANDHLLGEVAEIYIETSQYNEGMEFFSKLHQHVPDSAAISLRRAQLLFYKGDHRQALAVLTPALASFSHRAQAVSLQSRIHVSQGKIAQGLEEYRSAEAQFQNEIRKALMNDELADYQVKCLETLQIEIAELLIDRQLFREAEEVLYHLSETIPSDPEVIKLMDMAKLGLQEDAG